MDGYNVVFGMVVCKGILLLCCGEEFIDELLSCVWIGVVDYYVVRCEVIERIGICFCVLMILFWILLLI